MTRPLATVRRAARSGRCASSALCCRKESERASYRSAAICADTRTGWSGVPAGVEGLCFDRGQVVLAREHASCGRDELVLGRMELMQQRHVALHQRLNARAFDGAHVGQDSLRVRVHRSVSAALARACQRASSSASLMRFKAQKLALLIVLASKLRSSSARSRCAGSAGSAGWALALALARASVLHRRAAQGAVRARPGAAAARRVAAAGCHAAARRASRCGRCSRGGRARGSAGASAAGAPALRRLIALRRRRAARLLHRAPLGGNGLTPRQLFNRRGAMLFGNFAGRCAVEVEALRARRDDRFQVGIRRRVAREENAEHALAELARRAGLDVGVDAQLDRLERPLRRAQ